MSAPRPELAAGLVTLGETMGLVVQATPGPARNGEPMCFGIGGSESNLAIGVRRLGMPATRRQRSSRAPLIRSAPRWRWKRSARARC